MGFAVVLDVGDSVGRGVTTGDGVDLVVDQTVESLVVVEAVVVVDVDGCVVVVVDCVVVVVVLGGRVIVHFS